MSPPASLPLSLEEFDPRARARRDRDRTAAADALAHRLARERGQARADGYEAGVRDATALAEQELAQASARLAEAVADALTGAEQARAAALAALGPVAAGLVRAMAPALAEAGLADEIAAAARAAALDGATGGLMIAVAPGAEAMAAAALTAAGVEGEIRIDPELTPGEARVQYDGGYDRIDFAAAAEAAAEAVAACLRPSDLHPSQTRRASG